MERLAQIATKPERRVVGLMSGTSLDGVDAALVYLQGTGLDTRLRLEAFTTFPYPAGLKEFILARSQPGSGSVDTLCRLNVLLGEIFAEAALAVIAEAQTQPADVDLIGSHGQTVHHLPEPVEFFGAEVRATLQLAEPAVIAKRTGIVTVADFRPADMAVGGQGAPLVPYFDYVVFRSEEESRLLVNIGGIANLTLLPRDGGLDDLLAFDSGPGNMLIDALTQKHFGQPYDQDGEIARRGTVHTELLGRLLDHPYLRQPPPKSTGRELFGVPFLEHFEGAKIPPEDAVATATAFTAETIAQAVQRFVLPRSRVDRVIVSGGGVRNSYLMRLLEDALPGMAIDTSDLHGVPVDAKEAMCFALLANETIAGHATNVPTCTGAVQATVLGKICL